jgi:superfamily II DNA or RNA helicase
VIVLHQFQHDAVAEIEQHIAEGRLKLLLVAPTGSGKTVIASELIRRWVAQCPPSALVRQIGWVEEGRISGSS